MAGTSTTTGDARPHGRRARWADPAGCTLEELLDACFYGVGAVYRRAVFDAVGGFREGIYAEDYLFWLLALAHGHRHRHIPRPLSVHRRTEAQKSADALLMRETDLRVVTEVMGTGLLSEAQLAAGATSAVRLRRSIRHEEGTGRSHRSRGRSNGCSPRAPRASVVASLTRRAGGPCRARPPGGHRAGRHQQLPRAHPGRWRGAAARSAPAGCRPPASGPSWSARRARRWSARRARFGESSSSPSTSRLDP